MRGVVYNIKENNFHTSSLYINLLVRIRQSSFLFFLIVVYFLSFSCLAMLNLENGELTNKNSNLKHLHNKADYLITIG
jgi:hypothetical protein